MKKLNRIFTDTRTKNTNLLSVLVCSILLFSLNSFAQSSEKLIHEGNKQYEQKKFNEAEINYRKSLNTKENEFIGNYNLGNTYYQQGKYEEAKQQFEIAAGSKEPDKKELSSNYHNLGNALLKNNKYEESIEAYKQSLKLNPSDNDTRYNLAYAKSKLQQQQQQQKNKDNKQDKNKDQKKDDKSQQQKDKEQQQKDKEQQQKDQEAKKDEPKKDKQEKAANKDKISKEDAEKILQALNNDEKKTQKKMNVKERVKVSIEKEW